MNELQEKIYGGVEKEILNGCSRGGVRQEVADRQIEAAKKPLIDEMKILELKRQHILDRRNSWLPKSIWNIFIPIIVAIATTYLLKLLIG